MVNLSLDLLGSFQVRLNGQAITRFRTSKAGALLIYLAVENSPAAGWRPSLATLFWPGKAQESAQQNLRQTIYLLRKGLAAVADDIPQPDIILADQQRVLINPVVCCHLDTSFFNDLLTRCWRHQHTALLACQDCSGRLQEAVNLYQGDFLTDFYLEGCQDFEEWASGKRETLRWSLLDALEKLTAIKLRQGNLREARRLARRQLAVDSLRELAHLQLMEALARSGQRHEALVVFDRFEQLLKDEMGISPLPMTRLRRDLIAAGEYYDSTTS